MTYIDTGCGGVEFLSGNWFLRCHVGFDRKGWEQVRFSELPFYSGSPTAEKTNMLTGAYELLMDHLCNK